MALKPGGIFVNADQAEGETPYFRQRYLDYWNDFLRSGPMTEEQHAEILKRRDTLDRNEKLSDQLAWLKEAGFSDVDVVYRNRTFIVTVARRT
jgi:tRNA (cmo5U34)-methyltransferase